jgi:hypothetical protein
VELGNVLFQNVQIDQCPKEYEKQRIDGKD